MHLPLPTLALLLPLVPLLTHAIALPNPNSALDAHNLTPHKIRHVYPRQGPTSPESEAELNPEADIEPPRDDGLVPFAGGGPVVGKFVQSSFTPGPLDHVVSFANSVELKKRKEGHTASNAFCPYPGTAYCCNFNPGTGGTLCKWNGDGHLSGCELITGGESVCCSKVGCKGMQGLREPITTV
ncbi:hypothetical protein OCU04_011655 [Sclerotinia nivalis]|uniref:Uncharacterized protein n=1 Tax=Sclerotinia nivalis TaxID=352851 RepID=A0A9X0DEZ9_9HELO|nr:hypothetical protein OCU04_011655 [Sclerotinia nivalis]